MRWRIKMNVKTNKPETLVLHAGLIARSTPTTIGRLAALLYGIAAYLVFSITFLYAIGFVEGLLVSKTIDTATAAPMAQALLVNLVLMSIFANSTVLWRARVSSSGGQDSCRLQSNARLTCYSPAWRWPSCSGSGAPCRPSSGTSRILVSQELCAE